MTHGGMRSDKTMTQMAEMAATIQPVRNDPTIVCCDL